MSGESRNTQVIVLAAGKGRRMNSDLPKVLHVMNGRTLLDHVLETVAASNIDPHPVVVLGYQGEAVKAILPAHCREAWQKHQGGTGHAVRCALETMEDGCSNVLVLYGDMPLVRPETIQRLVEVHVCTGSVISMTTIVVDDFGSWRTSLADYGRVLRDPRGDIIGVREVRDASPDELLVREVNPSHFCFSAEWLREALPRLTPANAQGEYYLTDLVALACGEERKITTILCDASEGLGVNTPEQLAVAEQLATSRG